MRVRDGFVHISYYERTGDTTGIVKHAYRADPAAEWQVTTVDELDAVATGFTGARNITSIDIDSGSAPWIVYSDESVMKLAQLVDGCTPVEEDDAFGVVLPAGSLLPTDD